MFKNVTKSVYRAIMKDLKESFPIIPRGSKIKKMLREKELPFSFEVPFVIKDDLESIVKELNQIPLGDSEYMMSFKEDTNTLVIRTSDEQTHNTLSSVINSLQIYGPAEPNIPLGPQDTKEVEEEVKDEVKEIIYGGELCPVCGEANTKLMGESIRFCTCCTALFESKKSYKYNEDILLEPVNQEMKDKIEKHGTSISEEEGDVGGEMNDEEILKEEEKVASMVREMLTTASIPSIPQPFNKQMNKRRKYQCATKEKEL